jgi:hypothetical protein
MKKRVLMIAALVSGTWRFLAAPPTPTGSVKRVNPVLAQVLAP